MAHTRSFVIPESWAKEATMELTKLNEVETLYSVIPVANYEEQSKARLRNLIVKTLRSSSTNNAVVVLPKSFATGLNIKYWPDILICKKSEIIITSVIFADSWSECNEIINSWAGFDFSNKPKQNLSCQYQTPYTEILELWSKNAAQSFHPGDYFKHEILEEIKKMQGNWLYWGHSDSEKLHGYNHLSAEDILQYKPVSPLQSTLWFSCSTLDSSKKSNIALRWYLSGATHCLFACTRPIKTTDNQILSMAWLEVFQELNIFNVADIIQKLVKQDQQTFKPILSNYRLLGLPWV